jgi:putative membrane protein
MRVLRGCIVNDNKLRNAVSYDWYLALHIISVIAWMAALLYLPRLFVYHAGVPAESETSQTFKVMERRLQRAIMTPAMIASFVFGLLLIWEMGEGALTTGWLHAKIVLILALTVMHGLLARWRKDFEADRNRRSGKFYRVMNEVPTVLMIGIVILAVVKPF